jgi:hypothetical protein
MAFTIYSNIISNVVSVKTDELGTFQVVGTGPTSARTVNLGYAEVHVAGPAIRQAQRYTEANGMHFKVVLVNNDVRIQPVPR